MDNAWRYNCKQKGEIRITGQANADRVTVEIANTGPGVSAEETELVFEQFYRVEKSRSLAGGGSGLGLTIARTIVRLHGGEIRLSTDSAGWTRVVVTLPPAATAYINTGKRSLSTKCLKPYLLAMICKNN